LPFASHFILYVSNQEKSTIFYAKTLDLSPHLNVPGMTEFALPGGGILGLMPISGIRNLLGSVLPDPASALGVPRSEIYLVVNEPIAFHTRALRAGASELSPCLPRNWGHAVAYSLDPDGHVLAFASPSE